jgi:hypothetical protein
MVSRNQRGGLLLSEVAKDFANIIVINLINIIAIIVYLKAKGWGERE